MAPVMHIQDRLRKVEALTGRESLGMSPNSGTAGARRHQQISIEGRDKMRLSQNLQFGLRGAACTSYKHGLIPLEP